MQRLIVGGLAVSALIAVAPLSIASAADMAVKAAPLPPAPVSTWSSCYVGANAGGAWSRNSTTFASTIFAGVVTPAGIPVGSANPDGAVYGGQIGCDYQLNTTWVVGVRGMWDGSSVRGSNVEPPFPTTTAGYKSNSFGTVVGKVGYLLNPTLELYGLGGVAWVHDKFTLTDSVVGQFAAGEQTRSGYDIGAGLSWMFARNWDAFVEYDHMGFGTKDLSAIGTGVGGAGATFIESIKQSVDEVLVGVDYRFAMK